MGNTLSAEEEEAQKVYAEVERKHRELAHVKLGAFETQVVRKELRHRCDVCKRAMGAQARMMCCTGACTENSFSYDLCLECSEGHEHPLVPSSALQVLQGFASSAETLRNRLRCFCGRRAFQSDLSYRWVHLQALTLLVQLRALGVRRLMICARNSPLWFVVDAACILGGILSIPVQRAPALGAQEVSHIISKTSPDLLITDDEERLAALFHGEMRSIEWVSRLSPVPDDDTLEITVRDQEDPATIIWTSGSTGVPKGAIVSDGVLRSHLGSSFGAFGEVPVVHCSFMPLALGTERFMYLATIGNGGRICVLRDEMETFWEQIAYWRPTMFVAPPRVYSALYEELKDDEEKARNVFGPRITSVTTGGAPTSPHVMAWMRRVWSHVGVHESYGTTEGGGIAHNGVLSSNISIKLVDMPEMKYLSTDKPFPRGELLVKNAHVISGYIGDQEKTEAAMQGDYYKTGDVVEYDAVTRRIKVIDRIKSFCKLSTGQFIACEKIEGALESLEGVSQAFVTASSEQPFCVCVVVGRCLSEQLALPQLLPHEIPRRVHLEEHPWTPANGFLTPSFKKARNKLAHRYRQVVHDLYSHADPEGSKEGIEMYRAWVKRATVDSIGAVGLMHRLKRELNVSIPKQLLFSGDVDRIARFIQTSVEGGQSGDADEVAVDWSLELAPLRVPDVSSSVSCRRRILLTGATGFLGVHLLASLLRRPDRLVTCVVRGSAQRLFECARRFELPVDSSRVRVIQGDLQRVHLGQPASYDAVVHCAARVNGVAPYSALRGPNVAATRRLLGLGLPVAHIRGSEGSVLYPIRWLPHMGGYGSSKLVAEQLVTTSNVPHCVFRPGAIGPSSSSGVMNETDYLTKLTRTFRELDCVPDVAATIQIVPVDYVADGIVKLFDDAENLGRVFHFNNLAGSPTVSDAARLLNISKTVPFEDWRERVRADPNCSVFPLQNYFDNGWPYGGTFEDAVTVDALGEVPPKVDVSKYRF